MAICEKYRISHSHYLGGPSAWTVNDRALAEAYASWSSDCCSKCGTHPDWWDPEKGGHRFAFIADTRRCPGCELLAELDGQIPSDAKGVHSFLTVNPELLPDAEEVLAHA